MEVLDERWTLLIVRELVTVSQRFRDMHSYRPSWAEHEHATPARRCCANCRDTVTDVSLRSLAAGGAHALTALPSNM